MTHCKLVHGAVALSAALLLAGSSARADIMIVSSSAPDLKPGMTLTDSARLEVPAGAKVRVLLPSGATLQVNGVASRPVKEITKGEPIVEAVWSKAKELFATGGVDQTRVGATRSFRPAPPPAPAGFSWTAVSIATSGTVCVERGAKLSLERPAAGRQGAITVIDTQKNARAEAVFAGNATRADWPASLAPTSGTTYQITAADTPVRQITLRLVDKAGTSEPNALRSLLENGCKAQATALTKN